MARLYRMSERGFLLADPRLQEFAGMGAASSALISGLAIIMVFVNVACTSSCPKDFFPQQDTGRLSGTIMGDQDVSFHGHARQDE